MLRHSLKVILLAICFVVAAAPSIAQVAVPPGGCIPVVHRNWSGCVVPAGQATTYCVVRAGTTAQTTMVLTQAGYDLLIARGQISACAATPSCTQSSVTRTTTPCPAGQTGIITEQRTINIGDVCGVNGPWSEISNTCKPCTEGTETRTLNCPAGQVGAITQTRATNEGGYCGRYGNWQETSNTCQAASCTTPWGQTLANGQSVTAYSTQSVPYGQTCVSQTRTCTNGVLSGTYTYQNCSPEQPPRCTLPWGGTIAIGQSVTAYQAQQSQPGQQCVSQTRTCNLVGGAAVLSGTYTYQSCSNVCTQTTEDRTLSCPVGEVGNVIERRTLNVGGVCGQNSSWTEVTRACEPVVCPLPWGGQILYGQSVTAYLSNQSQAGQACVFQTRTCQANGTLTGTYTYQNCTQTCTTETETRTTTPCPSGQTGVITEQRTLNVNGQCGNHGSWTQVSNTCTPITCPLPWGGTIGVGQSVTAYSTATAPNGQACASQTRTCQTNGLLTGTYTYQNCTTTCTQQTVTRTNGQQCPAGQTGVITEQQTVNVGGVCGQNSAWTVVSNTCQPIQSTKVLLLAKPKTYSGGQVTEWTWYPYCTNHYATIGLEFDPDRPYKVDVVLVTGSANGQIGFGCGSIDSDGNTGRLKFAEIKLINTQTGEWLVPVAQRHFSLTAKFYANINGCGYTGGVDANGNAARTVTLNIDRTQFSTTYVDFAYDTAGNQLTGATAAQAVIMNDPCVPYADFTGKGSAGLFGLCSQSGTQKPGYLIWADQQVQIH